MFFDLSRLAASAESWDSVPILAVIVVAAITSYVVYQTLFHPLARYPGPFLAKLTNLYSVYHAIRGNRHLNFLQLHQRHGDFVRFGPNHISINNSEALERIYGTKANTKKSHFYTFFYGLSIFNAIDKGVHARKRHAMSQAFSDQAVREMQPHIIRVVGEWCAALGDRSRESLKKTQTNDGGWTSPKDMRDWCAYVIFDSLGELLLGNSFETIGSDKNRPFLHLMAENVRFINIIGQVPLWGRLNLSAVFMRGKREERAKQIAFSRSQLRKRLALGADSDRRDIIHYLQKARDPETGCKYSEEALTGETVLLLAAGADAANTALTSIWYFLGHHPDVLNRLTESIRRSFASAEQISSGHVLTNNAYLKACVDESLRLCPPVPTLLPREVCPGGLNVMGHHLPQGTVVGVPTYALHHKDGCFDRPFEYDPSRWLAEGEQGVRPGEGNDPEVLARQRAALIPFSVGPRACIGKKVSLLELYATVARVLFDYDLRLQPGTEHLGVGPQGEYKIRDHFIVGKEGPILQFRYKGPAACVVAREAE